MQALIVDCLTAGDGKRKFTRDFIGAGPRYIAGFIEHITENQINTTLCRGETFLSHPPENFHSYSILCISAMTMDKGIVQKVVQKWHKIHPIPNHTLVLLGGPISSESNYIHQINIDAMIFGEAEWILTKIFKDNFSILEKNLGNIKPADQWKNKLVNCIPSLITKIPKITTEPNQNCLNEEISAKNELMIKNLFENSSGFPEKIQNYPDFQYARIFVECLRGCSNYRRTGLTLNQDQSCEDNPCNICRNSDFTTQVQCPANIPPGCGFCSTIGEFGSPKSRNVSSIVEEIKHLINMGARRIVLGGPDLLDFHREDLIEGKLINPTYPEPNYSELDKLISLLVEIPQIKQQQVQLFIENIKAVLCTSKALDILAKIPNSIFSIGCETGSEEFANLIGRPGSPLTTFKAVQQAMGRGIRVHVYFIHSLPGDNEIYAQDTLKLLKEFGTIGVEKITIYKYQELPGSPFWKIPRNYTYFSKKTEKMFTKIKKFVIGYNRLQKEHLLGKTVTVFLSEKNSIQSTDAMGWILQGGPKVSVINGIEYLGQNCKVFITRIISDRLVEGSIER